MGSQILSESSNKMARQSPYPLRSSKGMKDKAARVLVKSELEDVQCVICMEPPHNAVLLRCSSSINGCRPYICGTSASHSNCFKQFIMSNKRKDTPLKCPLCRGKVSETTKVSSAARRIINAKPRSCHKEGCNFFGTYSKLNKHLKTEHRGLIPWMVDPQRQQNWEQRERDDHIQLMRSFMGNQNQVSNNPPPRPLMFQVDANGTLNVTFATSRVRTGLGPANYATTLMPRLQFGPRPMHFDLAS